MCGSDDERGTPRSAQERRARVTAVTNVFTGRPARGIVNRIVREVGPISAAAPPFPLAVSAVAPLRAKPKAWERRLFTSVGRSEYQRMQGDFSRCSYARTGRSGCVVSCGGPALRTLRLATETRRHGKYNLPDLNRDECTSNRSASFLKEGTLVALGAAGVMSRRTLTPRSPCRTRLGRLRPD